MMQLGEVIFAKLNKTEVTERIQTSIPEKEMDGLNYLSGYIMMKDIKKHQDEKQVEAAISLLDGAIEKDCTNDHINTLSRGGLITLTEHCLRRQKKNVDVLLKLTTYGKLMLGVFQVNNE